MHLKPSTIPPQDSYFFSQKTGYQWLIIGMLLLTAFGIRLYHITKPPMDFAAIRQYQSAHIARGLYYENNDSISESRKKIEKLNMQRIGFLLEPRIMESVAVLGYRIIGSEQLWIPRVVSSIFWVIGGFFLFLIARRTFSPGAAMFSTAYYLFLPFGISASRSFQPDPLMVMLLLASVYSELFYFERPSVSRLLVSAIVSSLAIFVKPYCLFPIWAVFIFISIHDRGVRKTVSSMTVPMYIVISFIPAFFQYVYGMFVNTGFLQEHARGSFLPYLIFSLSFWKGWLVMIGSVTGYLSFVFAGIGFINAPEGKPKALLAGLWAGYFLFGLSATYQMHTHSYYHIPFIPIAALSLGPIGAGAVQLLFKRWRISLVVFCVIVSISAIGLRGRANNIFSEHKKEMKFAAAVLGINPEFKEFITGNYAREMKIAEEIGERVGHSTNTVFLTPDFGRVLAYHGELSGLPWPTSRSLYGRKVRGTRVPNIHEDFTAQYIMIGYQGKYIKYTPDYFIVTDFTEFEKQYDLRKYLNSHFPVLFKHKDYMIFDLRKMSKIHE